MASCYPIIVKLNPNLPVGCTVFVVTGVFGREIDPEVVELFDDPDDPDLPMACGRRGRWLRKTPLLDEAETEVGKKYVNFDH